MDETRPKTVEKRSIASDEGSCTASALTALSAVSIAVACVLYVRGHLECSCFVVRVVCACVFVPWNCL